MAQRSLLTKFYRAASLAAREDFFVKEQEWPPANLFEKGDVAGWLYFALKEERNKDPFDLPTHRWRTHEISSLLEMEPEELAQRCSQIEQRLGILSLDDATPQLAEKFLILLGEQLYGGPKW